jgi:hypothetical protein
VDDGGAGAGGGDGARGVEDAVVGFGAFAIFLEF